jgi:signal transduction histidine kinase
MRWLGPRVERAGGQDPQHLLEPGDLDEPPEATVALVRTAQEALVNTAQHAPRQPVDIGLHYSEDGVMIISNQLPAAGDARGRAVAFGTVNGGYGLTGMRERLLLIRGTLTAASDGTHWTVTAQVPQ